jgi:hypothetical protein
MSTWYDPVVTYLQFTHVYLMGKRSQALQFFTTYKSAVENLHNSSIKYLHVDNAPEYVEGTFWEFTESSGILFERTISESPQQNGTSKCHKYTFECMARTMLLDGNMQDYFWPFAIQSAIHIKNRVPHSALAPHSTPFKLWHECKPTINHICPFSAHCTAHIVNMPLSKFKLHRELGHFLGYSLNVKGYLFWHTASQSVKSWHDLTFHAPLAPSISHGGVDHRIYNPLWSTSTLDDIIAPDHNIQPKRPDTRYIHIHIHSKITNWLIHK